MTKSGWAALAQGRYINLESYRRDGTPVRTPLWFAETGDALVAYTVADSPKVRRLLREPRCRIAACDMRGVVTGQWFEARTAIVTGDRAAAAMRLLNRKYWPWKQILGLFARFSARGRVVIAIHERDGDK